MKLNFSKIEVERSTTFKSQNFDIGNKRIVLEILRGKLYSNPIQAICQEYMSNARDAHREIGKNDIPVEVKLPNKLDPSFFVRDFGPGISPDRMSNVFIQYGCSTKREDNTQTGAYGIGAKSSFSLLDSFTIISITPENDKLIRREYIAHIDESGLGQLSCVKEESTSDPQGTTILLYPKESDFHNFPIHVKRAANHWKTKPIILGDPEFFWDEIKLAHTGNNWEIHEISPLDRSPYALIDEIPYPINMRHIYGPAAGTLSTNKLAYIPLRLIFQIGEIPVTANREEIDYQPQVIAYIKDRLQNVIEELKTQLTSDLENAQNLREAVLMWQTLRKKAYGHFLSQTTWKDINLENFQTINLENLDLIITCFRRDSHTSFGCRKTYNGLTINVNSNTLLIENDLKTKGVRPRLATLFDKNQQITYIIVIDFTKKFTTEISATGAAEIKIDLADEATVTNRKKLVETKAHWSLLSPIILSTIEPKKIILDPGDKKTHRVIKIKKLIGTSESNSQWSEIDIKTLDTKTKLYVVLTNKTIIWNNLKLGTKELFKIITILNKIITILDPKLNLNLEIYGILPSYLKKIEDNWQPYYGLAQKLFVKYKSSLPNQFGSDFAISRKFNSGMSEIFTSPEFINELSSESLLLKYIKMSQEINDASFKVGLYNDLCVFFGETYLTPTIDHQKDIEKIANKVMLVYPLLRSISFYSDEEGIKKDILAYIKMKDQTNL